MAYTTISPFEKELTKKEKLPVGWPWRLLTISIIVFLTTIAIFLGITFGFKPYLESKLADADTQLNQLNNSISEQDQKNLLTVYSQLNNINGILSSRYFFSKLLDFLAANTLKSVFFDSAKIDLKELKIGLEGKALTYSDLSQQMEVFKNAPEIERVILSSSRLEEKQKFVNFSMSLDLKEQ